MIKRTVMQATGEVQKVGYRDFVQKAARTLGVVGTVENMRNGSVLIVCEAEESVIEEFKNAVNVKFKFIDVEEIKVVETAEPTGEFEYFDIKRGEMAEELGERLDVSILYLGAVKDELKDEMHTGFSGLSNEMKTGFSDLKEETKKTHEKLDNVSGKLDNIDNRLGDALERYDSFGKDMGAIRQDIGDMKLLASEFREFKDLFAIYVKHQLEKDSN